MSAWQRWRYRRRLKEAFELIDVQGGRPMILPPTPELCYHRRRHSSVDLSGSGVITLRCEDCGAQASATYGAPLPDLPPMPVAAQPSPGAAGSERGDG